MHFTVSRVCVILAMKVTSTWASSPESSLYNGKTRLRCLSSLGQDLLLSFHLSSMEISILQDIYWSKTSPTLFPVHCLQVFVDYLQFMWLHSKCVRVRRGAEGSNLQLSKGCQHLEVVCFLGYRGYMMGGRSGQSYDLTASLWGLPFLFQDLRVTARAYGELHSEPSPRLNDIGFLKPYT